MTQTQIGVTHTPAASPASLGSPQRPLGRSSEGPAAGFLWIDLDSPSDEEMRRAAEHAGISPEVLAGLRRTGAFTPRRKSIDGRILLDSAAYRHRGAVTKDDLVGFTLLIGPDSLVTVRRGPIAALDAITERTPGDSGSVTSLGVTLDVLDRVAEGLLDASQSLEDQAGLLGDAVLSRMPRRLPQRLLALHRAGIKLQRLLVLETSALERMSRLPGHALSQEEQTRLTDILHQLSHADALSDSVILENQSALNAHLNVLNNRMSDVMKVLAAVGTVFLPLAFLTGLYGTNFNPLPGADSAVGFWVLVGVAVALILTMAAFFYRLGWFRREG